jgi:hypothetical protein
MSENKKGLSKSKKETKTSQSEILNIYHKEYTDPDKRFEIHVNERKPRESKNPTK